MDLVFNDSSVLVKIDNDSSTFAHLRDIIQDNFLNYIGNKNKILIFNDPSEKTVRKYFLNKIIGLSKKNNENQVQIDDISKEAEKNIRLVLEATNQLKLKINLTLKLDYTKLVMMINASVYDRVFFSYLQRFLATNKLNIVEGSSILELSLDDENVIQKIEELIEIKELLNWYIDFEYDEDFMSNLKKLHNQKQKLEKQYDAIFMFLEEHYKTLGASKSDDIQEIRQNYLALAKRYHPDRVKQNDNELALIYEQKFKEIQIAYESIKTYHKALG